MGHRFEHSGVMSQKSSIGMRLSNGLHSFPKA